MSDVRHMLIVLMVLSWWSIATAQHAAAQQARDAPGKVQIAESVPRMAPDALAYYRFDPSRFDQNSAGIVPFGLQLAGKLGLIDPNFHPLFDGLLAASVAGSVPHTVCLLDFEAHLDPKAPRGFRVKAMQAVLVLETPANHHTYIQTLGTILEHYAHDQAQAGGDDAERSKTESSESARTPESVPAGQSLFTLSNGARAARFKAPGWADWQVVEWASLPESFVVGIGAGSIEHWIRAQTLPAESQEFLERHRRAIAAGAENAEKAGGAKASTFLEIFINLDRFHQTMADVMAFGRVRDILTTWKLDNARNWMFHGRWNGPFLVADITWQRRSEEPEVVAHRVLTLDHWPDDLTLPRPGGSYVVVIPMDFAKAFSQVMAGIRAFMGPDRRKVFDEGVDRYRAKQRITYDALWRAFVPYVVLSNDPPAPVPVPGATTVFLELKDAQDAAASQRRLESLIEQFIRPDKSSLSGPPAKTGETVVHHDVKARLYWLQLEPTGVLRVPTWGWDGPYLIGGWGPGAVEFQRDRIDRAQRGR